MYAVPVELVAAEMHAAVVNHLDKHSTHLMEIHLVDMSEAFLAILQSEFSSEKQDTELSEAALYGSDQDKMGAEGDAKSPGSAMKGKPGTDTVCCICMDDVTEEKQLGCGHKFCKECIAGWVKEKPTCPECGYIFGKITGTQPEKGEMIVTQSRQVLPGYEDDTTCTGTIRIEYDIPGGVQGVSVMYICRH